MRSYLNERVLILNKHWVPIATSPVKKIISVVFKGNASIICPESYQVHDFGSWKDQEVNGCPYIATPSVKIKVPEVVVLKNYDQLPPKNIVFSKKNIYKRDSYECQYCGKQLTNDEITIDHVIPRSRGGKNSWTNCVTCCEECNGKKGDSLLKDIDMKLKRAPREPSWQPYVLQRGSKIKDSWKKFIR